MNFLNKAIFTAASPNTQTDDALLALWLLVTPWNWNKNDFTKSFKKQLEKILKVKHVHLVDSGRSALYTALKSIRISKDDEVLMPSFTCVVVANAVSWSGATPIYLDTNEADFNAVYNKIENYISKNTKAIVVQHTFGKMVDVGSIRKKLHKLERSDIKIIEDFAHVIKPSIPLQGDIGFLTFGIEKVLSSVRGGAVITNDTKISENITTLIAKYPEFPTNRILISLANPVFWWIAIPLHSFGFGRATLGALIRIIWRKLGMLGIMVEEDENKGKKPDWIPAKLAGSLAHLGSKQLKKFAYYNNHRKKIAAVYHSYLSQISDTEVFDINRVYLRYPILLKNEDEATKVWNVARNQRITLGNWFSKPLYGNSVNQNTYKTLCYVPETTPVTLEKTKSVLNLPTSINISEERAKQLAIAIKEAIS